MAWSGMLCSVSLFIPERLQMMKGKEKVCG
jgi:hypothetical protein